MTNKKPKQSKHLASLSLAVMGGGFAATIPLQGPIWGNVLHGGFEAGLVGGLADWFAVTALFRHPMGVPIPHTALLPKNRKKMIKALVTTLENDWLSKESIQNKLVKIQFTEKILPSLEKELHSDSTKKGMVSLAEHMIRLIDIEKLTPFIEKELKSALSSIEISQVLQIAVNNVMDHEHDEKVLDYLLDEANKWVNKNDTSRHLGRIALKAIDGMELDGFMQFALKSFQHILNEEKLGGILQNLLRNVIANLKQPDDLNRQAFLLKVREELQSITEREEWMAAIETWKQKALADWQLSEQITNILNGIKQKALAFVQSSQFIHSYLLPFVTRLLTNVKEDQVKITSIENWIQNQIAVLVEENHSKIGKLVEENLDKLDNETLVGMMENNIGKDLQWIRVNGAVCGFVIGLVLAGVQTLVL